MLHETNKNNNSGEVITVITTSVVLEFIFTINIITFEITTNTVDNEITLYVSSGI